MPPTPTPYHRPSPPLRSLAWEGPQPRPQNASLATVPTPQVQMTPTSTEVGQMLFGGEGATLRGAGYSSWGRGGGASGGGQNSEGGRGVGFNEFIAGRLLLTPGGFWMPAVHSCRLPDG